jgi:hypothetical protein
MICVHESTSSFVLMVRKSTPFLSDMFLIYLSSVGLPVSFDSPPTSIAGLRVPIRKISREHGKAVFEQVKDENGNNNNDDNNNNDNTTYRGKWRIPLGAYQAFFTWLTSDPYTRVDGIPPHQLQIASLERARQEKGYPSEETLIQKGVPPMIAKALAPFQRGGVDFVIEKGGRSLIADGKQSMQMICMLEPIMLESSKLGLVLNSLNFQ